jgi:F-type H+-transporting ATPase subunit epsilon
MAGTLALEIATPERLVLKETVTEVQVPGAEGELGILPEHAPLLSVLGAGPLSYVAVGGGRKFLAIAGGWVEVQPDRVRILADRAEFADEIDTKRAQEALKRAEERLASPKEDLDVARALNAMKRAQARLACAQSADVGKPKR